jgi:serine/threonine-protein kinase
LRSDRDIAQVLKAAMLHRTTHVPLMQGPRTAGQHLLEVEVPGDDLLTLLAEPAGPETPAGFLLMLRPITRPQMAILYAVVERLDVSGAVDLPPASSGPRSDRTVMQPMTFRRSELPPSVVDAEKMTSLVPPPLDEMPDSFALPRMPPLDLAEPESADPSLVIDIEDFGPSSRALGLAADPLLGRVIARKYRLDSLIGSGSTAAVYRAAHMDLGRHVAVKVLLEQRAKEVQFVQRFRGEARAASQLEHPNVARVTDFGQEDDGLLYLVMELLVGRSLEAVLAASGKLPARVAVDIVIQASSGIAFAHDVGIVHRDVKPENLMLVSQRDDDGNPKDVVKVCDFGLAKLRDRDVDQDEDLTGAGMLMGSPAYMSPEQTLGIEIDSRTDIYALGVTLYECVAAAMPHDAMTLTALFGKKVTEAPRPLRSFVPDIDPGLEACIMRALATDRSQRPQTMRAFRDELRTVLAKLPTA